MLLQKESLRFTRDNSLPRASEVKREVNPRKKPSSKGKIMGTRKKEAREPRESEEGGLRQTTGQQI